MLNMNSYTVCEMGSIPFQSKSINTLKQLPLIDQRNPILYYAEIQLFVESRTSFTLLLIDSLLQYIWYYDIFHQIAIWCSVDLCSIKMFIFHLYHINLPCLIYHPFRCLTCCLSSVTNFKLRILIFASRCMYLKINWQSGFQEVHGQIKQH